MTLTFAQIMASAGAMVVGGLGTFQERWCRDRHRCREDPPGPCPGHGSWRRTR